MSGGSIVVSEQPRMGWTDVSTLLTDYAITTWDVDPNRLGALLPSSVRPDVYRFDDGRERAFVSAVSFLNTRFYVGFAPFVRLTCQQTNYRAYVRRGDEHAVWFFATSLATPFIFVPRHVWRLPWFRSRAELEAEWDGPRLRELSWVARSGAGEERLHLRGTGRELGQLEGFSSPEQAHRVLTHPTVGYLHTRGGKLVTYSVWHAPLELELADAVEARFGKYEELGLVEPDQPPHSVLVQQQTQYLVFLPPKRVRESG